MIGTNNRKVIHSIARKSMKANRMRNIIIICAIVLTTLLFTSIFTIALNLNKSMEYSKMKTSGADFHGSFKYLKEEEVEKLKKHPYIKEYGRSTFVGRVEGETFKAKHIEILQVDENYLKHSFIELSEGRMPEKENEIIMSTWELDMLGIPYELGERIKLDVDINGQKQTIEFILSGHYKADKNVSMAGLVFVSDKFVQKNVSLIDSDLSKANGSYVNTTNLYVMFSNSFRIEEKMKKILSDADMEVYYGVNWAYTSVTLFEDPSNLIPYIVLIFIIMLSGYLLIYNIFYISVVRDIKFYGLLKTIGTTKSQLKAIILTQANILYIVALPIGLAAGYGAGCLLTPLLISITDVDSVFSINPLIFIGAALFSYATVWTAARKPGRVASKVSPVEAVRFSGVSTSFKKKMKNSKKGAKLYMMSFTNLFRNKRKLFIMLSSLSISIIVFSIIFTIISGIDVKKYLKAYILGDFVVMDKEYLGRNFKNDRFTLTENMCNVLGSLNGVKSIDKVYFKRDKLDIDDKIRAVLEPLAAAESPDRPVITSILMQKSIDLQIHGIDSGWYDSITEKDVVYGALDKSKFDSGSYAIITEAFMDSGTYDSYYKPGDNIRIGNRNKSYEVMAVLKSDALYAAGTEYFYTAGYKVFLPSDEFNKGFVAESESPLILSATINAHEDKLGEIEEGIKAIVNNAKGVGYKSREDYIKELEDMISIMKTTGYSLSFIIALIGILNFINTVITGVISRRNEFAMLESIGMTRKQLKKMLVYEGFYKVLLTTIIVSTLGMFLTYVISKNISQNLAFATFKMNLLPFAAAVPILVIVSYVVTNYSYKALSKATIVERLREVE